MSGKSISATVKHVIILVFSTVIVLATSLYFSEIAFAEESEQADAAAASCIAAEAACVENTAAPEPASDISAGDAGAGEGNTAAPDPASDIAAGDAGTEKTVCAETADSEADLRAGSGGEAQDADIAAGTSDTVNTADAETADSETADGESASESAMFRAGEAAGALDYLFECLMYHGDEEDPSAFSLRAYTESGQSIVTQVKDQTPWQTCWGFSAIAASESSILSECYAKWDQLAPGLLEKYDIHSFKELCEWLDLSERQLAWFAFVQEPENGNYPSQAGEGLIANQYGMGGIYNALGGAYYATSVFARGTGPLEQSRVPYQNNEGVLNEGVRITANDGTEYYDRDYRDYMTETRDIEYECLIPPGMTKEEVLDGFSIDPVLQEKIRQRLEQGVTTESGESCRFVDENGMYYHVVRMNELAGFWDGYPDILIFEDENKVRYTFDPETLSFPGLPLIRRAYYDWSVDESLHYASIVELENSNILPKYTADDGVNEAVIRAIKDELLAGRGVSAAFCADTSRPGSEDPAKYINTANNTWAHYTYSDIAGANHGVTIVGYNDNFPKTFFLEGHQPPGDGAWLVKNSWGGGKSGGTNFGSWGIDENDDGIGDGYFWLSYWDCSIQAIETYDYKVENLVTDRAEFDIRQYDLMTTTDPIPYYSEKEANVFSADFTTNVREIGVQHSSDDTTISYEIYLLNEGAADPTDGVLLASGSEYFKYAGYHRIKTDKVCIIPAGFRYSVVVTQMREGKSYVSVFYDFNEQSVRDKEADGVTGIRKYSNAVVNRGESYILDEGNWIDWVDYIPTFRRNFTGSYPSIKEEWICVDNFSIKAYADFIEQDLSAEATKIGSGEPSAAVGVADEDTAEADALLMLAKIHNEISNNETAEKAASVLEGCISADDYNHIVQVLIDPDRAAGLKVVVSTVEISASEIDGNGLKKLQEASDNIARYADISLLVFAADNGEYLGSLHRTDKPIGLAIAIPPELVNSGRAVYVLRLHNGVVEHLETTVEDGYAYFESDLFSRYALAYDITEPEEDTNKDKTDTVPEDPGSKEPAKSGVTKTGPGNLAVKNAQTAEIRVTPAETGDAADLNLWLVLMVLAAGAMLTAVLQQAGRNGC